MKLRLPKKRTQVFDDAVRVVVNWRLACLVLIVVALSGTFLYVLHESNRRRAFLEADARSHAQLEAARADGHRAAAGRFHVGFGARKAQESTDAVLGRQQVGGVHAQREAGGALGLPEDFHRRDSDALRSTRTGRAK